MQLAHLLGVPYRRAYRLSRTLRLSQTIERGKLWHHLPADHPLTRSLALAQNTPAMPLYSISDIAQLWSWSRGRYSTERVRQLLSRFAVPIQNRAGKGLVYLADLQKLLK